MFLVLPKAHSVRQTPVISSLAGEVDGVREGNGPQWTEEACKELRFPNPGFMTISHQHALLPPALTLGPRSPSRPNLEGRHQGVWKALGSSNFSFSPALSALLKCDNQIRLIKWLIDFISKAEGMAVRDPVLMNEQLNIQFPSLREAMESYALLQVEQFDVQELGGNIYIRRCIYSLLVFQFWSFVSTFK